MIFLFAVLYVDISNASLEIIVENAYESKDISVKSFDEFTLNSYTDKINVCSCSQKKVHVNIMNTGSLQNVYYIETDLDYAVVSQQSIRLNPDTSKDITIFLDIPCKGYDDDLTITATSMTGVSRSVKIDLKADFCSSFFIRLKKNFEKNIPCKPQTFKFEIQNVQDFRDSYKLKADDLDKYLKFSQNPVTVEAFEKKDVFVYFNPDCYMYGNYSFDIEIESIKTPLKTTLPFYSSIDDSYDFVMEIDKNSFDICNKEITTKSFSIKNYADLYNAFYFDLKGEPSWIDLDKESITLSKDQTGYISFIMSPELRRDPEKFDKFKLVTRSEYGDLKLTHDFNVTTHDCYSSSLHVQNQDNVMCSDDTYMFFNLTNKGVKQNTFDLKIGSDKDIARIKRDKIQVTIPAGSTERIPILLNFPDKKATYDITLDASTFSEEFNVKNKQSIDIIPIQECYSVSTSIKDKYDLLMRDSVIGFDIINTGKKKGSYNIYINNISWISLTDNVFTLDPGKTKRINLTIDPDNYTMVDTYPINISIISNKGYKYIKNFDIKIKENTLLTSLFSKNINIDPKTELVGILIRLFLVLSILAIIALAFIFLPSGLKNFSRRYKQEYKKALEAEKRLKRKKVMTIKSDIKQTKKTGKDIEHKKTKDKFVSVIENIKQGLSRLYDQRFVVIKTKTGKFIKERIGIAKENIKDLFSKKQDDLYDEKNFSKDQNMKKKTKKNKDTKEKIKEKIKEKDTKKQGNNLKIKRSLDDFSKKTKNFIRPKYDYVKDRFVNLIFEEDPEKEFVEKIPKKEKKRSKRSISDSKIKKTSKKTSKK